ncbi:GNAT family N-acetyltransferase [Dictyobacter arantiisoli]|uniref:N-acetyltransferase domain-containing protein n=1 Tax=Dictyobacter arantiisoli TaxID=2014874 RepID=A0A5A5TL62_9CHLR|nr:GNAT family N-acetyltransferase [Dictyobacter arantiisoli]GCF11803.1 hypothetical protein KDI_53670 [Dictyobacter arantiisoli]
MGICSDILQQVTYPGVVKAMEENLIEFILFCSCIPGAEAYKNVDHIAAITGILQPSLNVVMSAHIDEQQIKTRIHEIMQPFKERAIPMLWYLFPDARPTSLPMYLDQHGLINNGAEPGMALDLSLLPSTLTDIPVPEHFNIEEVASSNALQEWIHVSSIAFGGEPVAFDSEYGRFEQCLGWGQDRPYRRFLGRLNGKAIATSSLFLGAGVAGLFSVGTLPEAQRQGIGTAISIAPLLLAREAGYNIGVLQASEAGYKVYTKIGFRECCRIQTYLWAPA